MSISRFRIFYCLPMAFLLLVAGPAKSQQTGVIVHSAASDDRGYVLFSPVILNSTYLMDKNGSIVHTWDCDAQPGMTAYLLPDGSLLRAGKYDNHFFTRNGSR